jgi:phosphoribosyl 1,2-cyclic phosphodiesterase
MTIYGPKPEDGRSLRDVFDGLMSPPYFPVTVADLPGEIRFEGVEEGWFEASGARVLARAVPHTGLTFGFRLELNGLVIAYIPDHQQPHDGSFDIAEGVLELVTGADLLVHDAQYTPEEFDRKRTWGHCTSEYAVAVATAGRVRKLALFHHDPAHDDTFLDGLARQQAAAAPGTLEVIVAAEGMRLTLGAAAAGGASARRAAVSPST